MRRTFLLVHAFGDFFHVEEELLVPPASSRFNRIRLDISGTKNDFKKVIENHSVFKCQRCDSYGVVKKNSVVPQCPNCKKIMETSVQYNLSRKIKSGNVMFTKTRHVEEITV